MSLTESAANCARFGDDELLSLWTDREALVPEADTALDNELQRQGLKTEKAPRAVGTSRQPLPYLLLLTLFDGPRLLRYKDLRL